MRAAEMNSWGNGQSERCITLARGIELKRWCER